MSALACGSAGVNGIGGYFDFAPAVSRNPWPWRESALRLQSGRAAIAAAFQAEGTIAVWAPWFACGAVRDALAFAGVAVRGYALSPTRGVPNEVRLAEGERILCIDYFGISGAACDDAIARFGSDRVVIDASQSLLHTPRPGVATVYSPRKFCGVPDGGLLVNPPLVEAPGAADETASIERARALLLRTAGLLTEGYNAFRVAEASLSDCTPTAMSTLSMRLFDAIDFAHMRTQRIANHRRLANLLRAQGLDVLPLPSDAVPLCCPVAVPDAARLREALAHRGIFSPAYWPDAHIPAADTVGRMLQYGTLYLPCDQRYGIDDMDHIASTLFDLKDPA